MLFSLFIADIDAYFSARGAQGVNIDNKNDVTLLMYADDLVILAYSEVDVGRKLNLLEQYSQLNCLKVNVGKTKIMKFCRGGFKVTDSPFYLNGEKVELTNKYAYLGVTMSSSSLFCEMANVTADRAKHAVGAIIPIMAKAKLNTWYPRVKLFESLVMSTMTNCLPVWGLRYDTALERVQTNFLKRVLCVQLNTPDYVMRLETGRVKLLYNIFKNTLNWLLNILSMPDTRLPKICFLQQRRMINSDNKFNWALQVKKMFEFINETSVWNNLSYNSLKQNKKNLLSKFYDKLYEADVALVRRSTFLNFYLTFTINKQPKNYLTCHMPIQIARTIAQLRLSNKFRLKFTLNNITYTINTNDICTACNKNEKESIYHVLFKCPIYGAMIPQNCNYFSNIDSFIYILDNLTPTIAKTIAMLVWNILKLRSFIMNE